MFSTTMAAMTMMGLVASGAFLPGPTWVPDYGTALRQAAEQGKPVAVFIADGNDGFAHVLKGGSLPADATKLLKDKYVSVFVDTTTAEGKATAKAFELQQGLVISNCGGVKQVLRHDGSVTPESLKTYLSRFAETTTVTTTESNVPAATVAPASYGSPIVNPFYCPSCQQGGRR